MCPANIMDSDSLTFKGQAIHTKLPGLFVIYNCLSATRKGMVPAAGLQCFIRYAERGGMPLSTAADHRIE